MSKMLKKTVAGVALGCALGSALVSGAAYASTQAVYFDAKTGPTVSSPNYVIVTLTNYTNYTYMNYSSNLPSHLSADMPVGRYGSSTSSIEYHIVYPDNVVCFDVIRSDNYVVYAGCLASGNYGIYAPSDNKAGDKVVIKAIK